MAEQPTAIVWFRRDLRLSDNPALDAVVKLGGAVVPLYIWSPDEEGDWKPGAASRWWLHHSLSSLTESLNKCGVTLTIRSGSSEAELKKLAKEIGATHLFWNRLYEPAIIQRDTNIKESLSTSGLQVRSFNSALLVEPWEIKNSSGKAFQVFTPYWRAVRKGLDSTAELPVPKKLKAYGEKITSLSLDELELLPKIPWDKGLRESWEVGENAAKAALERFVRGPLGKYSEGRDRPGIVGTSRMSPHLHFGEISPRSIWNRLQEAYRDKALPVTGEGIETYEKELGWREFAHHLLYHFPHTPREPLRENFKKFPWVKNARPLKAWQKGLTGYPIVDAGMRELWHTGWMHNRVRMIVASFLVKDLLVSWNDGAEWFWDTLVDASLASNTLGWQWTAGCGADAAPYFRVFNPTSQGERFDPNGDYVRKWIPELAKVPDRFTHTPWEATADQRGKYPLPIVDHNEARARALSAYGEMKG